MIVSQFDLFPNQSYYHYRIIVILDFLKVQVIKHFLEGQASEKFIVLLGWLVGFLTSSSRTMLYRGRVPRLISDNFTCCHTQDRVGRP